MFIQNLKERLFKKKKNKPLKQNLSLIQNETNITIKGSLSNPIYTVKELRFVTEDNEIAYRINSVNASNAFEFNIDLIKAKELWDVDNQIYRLFLYVSIPKVKLSEEGVNHLLTNSDGISVTDDYGVTYIEHTLRLGKFAYTENSELKFIHINGNDCLLYKTRKGFVSLAVNNIITPSQKNFVDYFHSKKHKFSFGGRLFTRNSQLINLDLIIVGRKSNADYRVPVSYNFLKEATRKKYGLNRYTYHIDLDLNKLFEDESFNEDIYDLFFDLNYHDFEPPVRIRVGNPRFKARFFARDSRAIRGDSVFLISPYFTSKFFNLSFQVDMFNKETYNYLRNLENWSWLIRPFSKRKDIWVVGEQPFKAQDTGLAFFKYMRENHPNKNIYYVIEADSPERKNVDKYGGVLDFKSKEHIWNIMMATKIIGSHHPDYLYPLRSDEFKKKVKGTKVFLQHGVMGTRNSVHYYGKNTPSFDADLFFVSSDYERAMIINDFEYDPREVKVTGLPRFDRLFDNNIVVKRQLLIIPTWREWLVNESRFLESEYFERYLTLVNDPDLHEMAKKYNFDIVFCLHPNMQKYTSYFKDAPVRVISQGEVNVQDLLKESAIMITDYSSVAFDFSFLTKPIIYYQFDRKKFIGKRGSHLDLDNDLPGDIVYDQDRILSLLEFYAQSNFKMKKVYEKRAGKFLKYKDQKSSERVYKEISQFVKKDGFKPLLKNELVKAVFKKYRKSKVYFPTMKLFYTIARIILPVDKNLILIESGVGKQFSDSPRYIYEEIHKRKLDYKIIWVCNKAIRFRDPHTKRINRLSPSYYYYLAKSKYWVNNQNFPTYIKKRPQTIYLQTWHGTPLKKMLFDIENVQGRGNEYKERVYSATKAWDYLISPSSYATRAFRSAFKYEGNIMEVGYPRNDIFYKEERDEIALKVINRLNLPRDKKIILYAPTFRDNQASQSNKFWFDISIDLEKMQEELGEDYILLLRMHVTIKTKLNIDKGLEDFVVDVSNYSDMQELLLITDILITDYSSVMFDFANTRRPILFYTYDLEFYRDQLRGFYMDFEQEAPGPLMRTTEDIINNVQSIEDVIKQFEQKYDAFYDHYCLLEDGEASARVVDQLFDKSK